MDESTRYDADRASEVNYLRRMLLGPAFGDLESLDGSPFDRYLVGILYPQGADAGLATEHEDGSEAAAEEVHENPIGLAFERLPASMGVSFLATGEANLEVRVWGAKYEKSDGDRWQRHPLSSEESPAVLSLERPTVSGTRGETAKDLWDKNGRCHVVWRKHRTGWLITVTVINLNRSDTGRPSPSDCLYQVGFSVTPTAGDVEPYPDLLPGLSDSEDEEFAMLYRASRRRAIGHGCAAEWRRSGDRHTVFASVLPSHEVPAIETTLQPDSALGNFHPRTLQLHRLADDRVPTADLISDLSDFVTRYEKWVQRCAVPPGHEAAATRVLNRLHAAVRRMRAGIQLLVADPQVLRCFRLANRAMLMQMLHSHDDVAGIAHARGKPAIQVNYDGDDARGAEWRPFQLGFHLLVLESLASEEAVERNVVDLIWFPTGGGKTEAYLWATAFIIFLRRLRHGIEGGGTAAIKRYTLRLLTAQQFQRAAALICACELLREEHADLGDEPIRVGLWVGEGVTPNQYTKARVLYDEMLQKEEPENPFQLQQCPWCGTLIVPPSRSDAAEYGVRATDTSFEFYCPEQTCRFHKQLPVAVVDDDLFHRPPALLIGTVDKFARMAWDARSGAFLGSAASRPPSLIIQDELHLISGPLGTVAGLYEAGIDTVLKFRGANPKVIAATATIRRAADQAQKLYGRPVAIFPPTGVAASDSYFARENKAISGRMYVGLMAPGHTPVTSLVRTAATLAQGVEEAGIQTDEARDAYWSLLIYHNSRRELGKTMTLARDDVPAWIMSVTARDQRRARELKNVDEVSANVSGQRLPEVLRRLRQHWRSEDCPDVVPCTNMISVGVDVRRLGIMLVNGQPKATAEYIQATSRVGRSKVPGLIVTLYSPTKPRDRSHYEDFVGYHSALYRQVEPTSVTPMALPARTRALHAALVIAVRLSADLTQNDDAMLFDPEAEPFKNVMNILTARLRAIEPEEAGIVEAHLARLTKTWGDRAAQARSKNKRLHFDGTGLPQFDALLCSYEEKVPERWPTLNSMRHVDKECAIHVFGTTT